MITKSPKSKKLNPTVLALLIPFVFIIAGGALLLLRDNGNSSAQDLPISSFLNAPETLRGNTYSLQCSIERQLAQNERGRILLVKAISGKDMLAVFIPPQIAQNFEVGQRYYMNVLVQDDILHVNSLEKF